MMVRSPRLGPRWLIFYTTISSLIRVAEGACYTQNGTESELLFPCNAGAEVSVCCREDDYCISNGLCAHAPPANQPPTDYVLGGCTDPNFPGECLYQCEVIHTCEYQNGECGLEYR